MHEMSGFIWSNYSIYPVLKLIPRIIANNRRRSNNVIIIKYFDHIKLLVSCLIKLLKHYKFV